MSSAIKLSKLDPGPVAQLRQTFDQVFSLPPSTDAGNVESLIAIRVAGKPFAMQANQIAGLSRVRRIVPLPSRIPELLGIAGIRGRIVPVLNLADLLGLESRAENIRWLVLARTEEVVAFGFEEFEGQVEIAAEALYREPSASGIGHGGLVARLEGGVRPVVNVLHFTEEIQSGAGLLDPARSSNK